MPKSICATTLSLSLSFSFSLSLQLSIHVFISFSYENILFFMPFVSHRFILLRFALTRGRGSSLLPAAPLCTDFALLAYFWAVSAAASARAHCALFAFNIYAKRFLSLIWDSIRTFQLAKLSGRNDF